MSNPIKDIKRLIEFEKEKELNPKLNYMTKDEIIDQMIDKMPFYLSDNVRPYIKEAMEIYAEQQVKNSNIPVIANHLFDVNTVLHTKDGRQIGNAIIIGKDDKYNMIKTDYGNECKFTDEEIQEYFYIAYSDLTDEEKEYMRETTNKHKHSV